MKRLSQDSLTGSYARDALWHYAAHFLAESRRTEQPFSMAMIDLDHFKSVNDAFGHARGDEILRNVAERIGHSIRDEDLLFRYGGDEFVLLLPACDKAEAVRIAGRVLTQIEGAAFSGEPPVSISLSLGVATFPEDANDPEQLFEKADARAYLSKRQGRARVVGYDGPPAGLHFDDSGRLVGRDAGLEQVQAFLLELRGARRGVLELVGPDGVGISRFLGEIARNASLRRFAVLALSGTEALATRLHGALSEARLDGERLETSEPEAILEEIDGHLAETGKEGLLITVDRLWNIDPYSWQFVDRLLHAGFPAVGVAFHARAAASPFADVPLRIRAELQPFTPEEVKLWLRSVLLLEPEANFVEWLAAECAGLPARLQAGLLELERAGALEQAGTSWVIHDTAGLDLQSRLEARKPAEPRGLPAWDTLFVGRGREIAELKRRVGQSRLVTLLGEGGIGKSRLAAQVGHELAAAFAGGIVFVSLAELRHEGQIAGQIVRALDVPPPNSVADPWQNLQDALAGQEILLILDNFEHLLDGGQLLSDLLESLPRLRILVTSREALRLPAETLYPLRGLDIPATADMPGFSGHGAVQLFLDRARGGDASEAANEAVLRVCRLVDGLPLALELAASWTAVLSCELIAAELEKSLAFLEAAPGRGERLWRVLDTFWDLLSKEEQDSLSRLALFRGGFREDAARAVAGASLFFLLALTDRAFVRLGPGRRYQMHELLRQYALGKLQDRERAQEAFTSYYAAQAAHYAQVPDKTKEGYSYVDAEFANLTRAWHWAADGRHAGLLHPLAVLLRGYCDLRGRTHEGLELFEEAERALADAQGEARATLGWALESQALFHLLQQRYARAIELAGRAQTVLAPMGHSEGLALCSNTLGIAHSNQGDLRSAQAHFLRAMEQHEALDNPRGVVQALGNHAVVTEMLGETDRALESYRSALETSRALGFSSSVCTLLCNLGKSEWKSGNPDQARVHLMEGLAVAREIGYHRAAVNILEELGHLDRATGVPERALDHFEEALDLCEAAGAQERQAELHLALAETLLALDRPGAAQAQLAAASVPLGNPLERDAPAALVCEVLLVRAALFAKTGDRLFAARLLGYLRERDELSEEQRDRAASLQDEVARELSAAALARALQEGTRLGPQTAMNLDPLRRSV